MTVLCCDVCSKWFNGIGQIGRHIQSHSFRSLCQCRFCGVRMSRLETLKRHESVCPVRNASQKNAGLLSAVRRRCHCQKCSKCLRSVENFYCDSCDKKIPWRAHLNRHIRTTHLSERLKCSDCDKFFSTRDGLFLHATSSHLLDAASSSMCDECQKNFPSYRRLLMHVMRFHNRLKNKFNCTFCQKNYGNSRGLNVHNCPTNRQKTPFQCDLCDQKFKRKVNCKVHVAVAHASALIDLPEQRTNMQNTAKMKGRRLMLQCSKCVHWFATMQALTAHELRHTKRATFAAAEWVSCPICGKRFFDKAYLSYHVSRHDHLSRFACSLCKRDYSTPCGLKKHVKKQHNGKKIALFQCDSCDKAYRERGRLVAHVNLHHISDTDRNDQHQTATKPFNGRPQFQCLTCFQRCSSKYALHNHELLHREKKVYFSCQFCVWTTSSLGSLYCHQRRHTKPNERFICFNCERSYAKILSLQDHMNYRHGTTISSLSM